MNCESSVQPTKLALFGGGRRVQRFYQDLLHWLQEQGLCEVTAICNRTLAKVEPIACRLNATAYSSPEILFSNEQFDAALVSVAPDYKEQLTLKLAKLGVHLFVDSPVPSLVTGMKLHRLVSRNQQQVEIAEDQSFSPEAQWQQKLFSSGEFGALQAVFNQGKEIGYHALARLHTLVGELPLINNVCARKLRLPGGEFCLQQEIEFEHLLYTSQYAYPKDHNLRLRKDFQLVCEKGVIGQCYAEHQDFGYLEVKKIPADDDGSPHAVLDSISINLGSKQIAWETHDSKLKWSRQHHGLHLLLTSWLEGIKNGTPLRYGLRRGLRDRSILLAWSIAAKTNLKIHPLLFPFLRKGLWNRF